MQTRSIPGRRRLWLVASFLGAGACAANQHGPVDARGAGQQITRAGTQASRFGPAESFTGRARLDPLFPVHEDMNASGAYVTFEAGARSAWHVHPAGQRLVVIAGVGRSRLAADVRCALLRLLRRG